MKAADDETMRAFSTESSSFAIIPNMKQRFDVSSAIGPPKEMAGSVRRANDQGQALQPSIAAVRAGPNGRVPFSSSIRTSAGFVAGWIYIAENEMQGFSLESPRTGRSHELHIPGTLEERTWAKWALLLSLFAGLARQSASL